MPEIEKCFHCSGEVVTNTSGQLEHVDYWCVRCRRGWKFVNGYWHSRSTASLEVYRLDGTQVHLIDDDYERARGNA